MAARIRTAYLPLPERQWFSRVMLVLLVLCSMALLVMSKTGNPWAMRLRSSITDAVTPVLAVAARPMDAIENAGEWLSGMERLREENVALKNQNIQLLQWQAAAHDMQAENEALRKLLHVVPAQHKRYITARIVSDMDGPYMHSALINGGRSSGIHKDEAVIDEKGLLGRVIETGTLSARVLLLSDINSRVPVIAEHAREKTILMGNNGDLPTLGYLPNDSKIQTGERLITSGDGGVFPEGIPVGVVASVEDGKVSVQLFADPAKTEYVSIVDYSF